MLVFEGTRLTEMVGGGEQDISVTVQKRTWFQDNDDKTLSDTENGVCV